MKTFRLALSTAFIAGLVAFGATGAAFADCAGHSTKSVDSGQSTPVDNSIADSTIKQTPIPSQGG